MVRTYLASATLLCLALAGTATAAASKASATQQAAALQQPVEELQELDEVWVRGKYTANMIVDAEDKFFRLYNKANKKDEYDISCGYMNLERGSMLFFRRCVPNFVSYNSYSGNYSSFIGAGAYNQGGCMSGGIAMGNMTGYNDTNGDRYYMASCVGYAYSYSPPPIAVPTGLLMMEKGKAYAANVDRVVESDPELAAMALKLVAMYDDMEQTQKQYIKVRNLRNTNKIRKLR